MCVQKLMLGCGGVTFDLKALFGKYTTKVNVHGCHLTTQVEQTLIMSN